MSTFQANTCWQVAVLPHASVAVYVRVWERLQPFSVIVPSADDIVGTPQLSVANAVPSAGMLVGLQPKSAPAGHDVNSGFTSSLTLIICVQVAVLPQASVAVHVRVIMLLHDKPWLVSD